MERYTEVWGVILEVCSSHNLGLVRREGQGADDVVGRDACRCVLRVRVEGQRRGGAAESHFCPQKLFLAGGEEVSHVGHHVWQGEDLAREVPHVYGPVDGASHLLTPGVEASGFGRQVVNHPIG